MLSAHAGNMALFQVTIPDFLDCTGPEHSDWQFFRVAFSEMSEHASAGNPSGSASFPLLQPELAREAQRLHNKWFSMLHTSLEDYPPGAVSFYHRCHFKERSDYCLYGHVAAITYLAKYTADSKESQLLARHAMRLLHWNHCLDFIESSTWASWGFTVLTLWDIVQEFAYPTISILHQHLDWGPGTAAQAPLPTSGQGPEEESAGFWVVELGTHRALSNEPVAVLRHTLSDYEVVHQNFIQPYEGRAEAFAHPFPQSCSPNCPDQQLDEICVQTCFAS